MSPPTRGRGLKHVLVNRSRQTWVRIVAPYAGAWIETSSHDATYRARSIHTRRFVDLKTQSPPTRGRGLKLNGQTGHLERNPIKPVAPYAGAWIETCCGLDWRIDQVPAAPSSIRVAPYAGAWIETSTLGPDEATLRVAPYAGAWIETNSSSVKPGHLFVGQESPPTRGRGLKPLSTPLVQYTLVGCRPLRGGVD